MRNAVLTEVHITTEKKMKRDIRIAHVSDLHSRNADDILDLLQKTQPDLILITGDTLERYDNRPQYDFRPKKHFRPLKWLIINAVHYTNFILMHFVPQKERADDLNAFRFLSEAAHIAPVYMSLGNHEQKLLPKDYEAINKAGVRLLDNEDILIETGGLDIRLGGMSSWDFEPWLEEYVKKDGYKLLMCHHPERFEPLIKDTDIDLVLSGHTHGGQIRVGKKGRGFFVPGQGLFGKNAHGIFFGGRLIVSAGCSNTAAFPRINNPRELVIINLRGA